MGQQGRRPDPLEDLPIGAVVDKNGLILSMPDQGTGAQQAPKSMGEIGTSAGKGAVRAVTRLGLDVGMPAIRAATFPVAGPMLLMNEAGRLPEWAQDLLPAMGHFTSKQQQHIDEKLTPENKEEWAGGALVDLATSRAAMGPATRTMSTATQKGANWLMRTLGLTEGEAGQALSMNAAPIRRSSVEALRQEALNTRPPRNTSPINVRQIYRAEIPRKRGPVGGRTKSTPTQTESLANRLMGEVEARTQRGPFDDVYDKMLNLSQQRAAPMTLTQQMALSGVPYTKVGAAVQTAVRPLPRSWIAQQLFNKGPAAQGAGMAGGLMANQASAPTYDRLRDAVIERLGSGDDPDAPVSAPRVSAAAAPPAGASAAPPLFGPRTSSAPAAPPALGPPAAPPTLGAPPAGDEPDDLAALEELVAARAMPPPNAAPVPLGRGVSMAARPAPPVSAAPDAGPLGRSRVGPAPSPSLNLPTSGPLGPSRVGPAPSPPLDRPTSGPLGPTRVGPAPSAPDEAPSEPGDRVFDSKLQTVRQRFQAATGHGLKVVQGRRSREDQAKKYAQGRSTKGPIITEADGTLVESKHQSGEAADLAFIDKNGKPVKADKKLWDVLGRIAKEEGLVWGGDWKSPHDPLHVQYGKELKRNPPPAGGSGTTMRR